MTSTRTSTITSTIWGRENGSRLFASSTVLVIVLVLVLDL